MGFLYGQGIEAGVNNLMRMFEGNQGRKLEREKLLLEQQKAQEQAKLQAIHAKLYQAQLDKSAQSIANRQGMMEAIGNSITPGGEYMAQGEDPTTGDMQSESIPYAPKMDFPRAEIEGLRFLDDETKPIYAAMESMRKRPVEERTAMITALNKLAQTDKFTAEAEKARRTPEKEPSIPLYKEVSISPTHEQDFMWNQKTKKHDIPIGQPRPINAKSAQVNVSTKVGTSSMEKLGEEMSKELVAARKDVEGAASGLRSIAEAEKLLDSGVITGTGAEYLVNVGNFLSSRLGFQKATDPVANTQAYAATMGNQVGQIIKQFGSGTGLSDADREYAEKIVGGKITLNEQAIRKLLSINKRAFTNVVEGFNKRADHAMSRPGADQLPFDLRVKMPEATGNNFRKKYNY